MGSGHRTDGSAVLARDKMDTGDPVRGAGPCGSARGRQLSNPLDQSLQIDQRHMLRPTKERAPTKYGSATGNVAGPSRTISRTSQSRSAISRTSRSFEKNGDAAHRTSPGRTPLVERVPDEILRPSERLEE